MTGAEYRTLGDTERRGIKLGRSFGIGAGLLPRPEIIYAVFDAVLCVGA